MKIQNYGIRSVLKSIEQRRMILPALQREFVWKRKDIEQLFDSLLQGFPINTMMFWDVDDIKNGIMEFYEFLDPRYQESVSTNKVYTVIDNEYKTIVIDGQQRLTSLWIAIYGSYTLEKGKNEMYLYLNLDAPNANNDDDSINNTESFYNFKFMPENKFNACSAKGEHWIRVSDAYPQNFSPLSYIKNNQLLENEFAVETVEKLYRLFNDDNVINAYEIKDKGLDHVLNIFVRTNSGGKPLTKGDLLLSVITVNWAGSMSGNAREYVQSIVNKVSEYGYRVDKDWVLSSILYILGRDIKLTVNNFDRKTADEIYQEKDSIFNSIEAVCKLLHRYGILERGLTSKLALLPITYHIYKFKLSAIVKKDYINGQKQQIDGVYKDMRTWLFRAILTGFFTSGTNDKLTKFQKIQSNNNNANYFPLTDFIKVTNSGLAIDDNFINSIMETEKKNSFPVLNVIYSSTKDTCYLNMDESYDVDHIHAAKNFRNSQDKRYDTIANLQLLNFKENRSKNDTSLTEWWNQKSDVDKKNYILPQHLDNDIAAFDDFFNTRYTLLCDILADKLGVQKTIISNKVINKSAEDLDQIEKHGEAIIHKHINNPSGSLAEFVKKCQSSAALEKDGLKDY